MRLIVAGFLAMVVGCIVGIGATWKHELRGREDYFEPRKRAKDAQAKVIPGSPKVVIVDSPKFDFGTLQFNASSEHKFVLRNEGDKALVIDQPQATCGRCIETEFVSATVEPGQTCEINVKYSAKKEVIQFAEGLDLNTNDPLNPTIRLEITGIVTKAVRAFPTELTLGTLSVTEATTATVKVLGYRDAKIELTDHSFRNAANADFFEIVTEPLPNEEVIKTDKYGTSGVKVKLSVKPGLPLGRINEVLKLNTKTDEEHPLDIAIHGEVVGDISLVGKEYNREGETVLLGIVNREKGKIAKLHILVKGAHRNDVKFTVAQVDPPDVLKATIGEGVPIGDGKAVDFPFTVEVVKNMPPVNRLGTAQGELAKIFLETTHPTSKKITINVRFATE